MPSITSWMRLEPRSRSAEMNTSLQARIYDPLWLLARQWQFGEFQGEDNGSPIMASWRGESAPVTHYHSGVVQPNNVNASRYDGRLTPLETVVERETVLSTNQMAKAERLRLAAEAGQQFLRMLDRMLDEQAISLNYRAAFIRQYPFPELTDDELDGDSLSFFRLIAGRVPDGRRLHAEFLSAGASAIVLPPALKIASADLADVREAARLWVQWYEMFFSVPTASNPSWDPERMEYAFSVGTKFRDGECVLTAPEYFEGHLDWYAFDSNQVSIGATNNVSEEIIRTAIPTPVMFGGMPAARFWEFEDAQVDFGSVDAGPTDLLRMLLVEFALAYGNDWFVIPVELDVGSVYQTRSLIISDTFGVRTLIKPSSELGQPHASWRMYQQSSFKGASAPKPNLFFLAPSLLKSLESRPIEEVLFLRDEMANMAWGVERIIESASEQPLNRFEQQRPSPSVPPVQSADSKLIYKLESEVPDNWVPLLPVKSAEGLRLARGKVQKRNGKTEFVGAQGRILNPEARAPKNLRIFEEEIPREGVRVTRHYQFARWHDGSTHLWIGRRKRIGSGEGSSGLRFDTLES